MKKQIFTRNGLRITVENERKTFSVLKAYMKSWGLDIKTSRRNTNIGHEGMEQLIQSLLDEYANYKIEIFNERLEEIKKEFNKKTEEIRLEEAENREKLLSTILESEELIAKLKNSVKEKEIENMKIEKMYRKMKMGCIGISVIYSTVWLAIFLQYLYSM